MLLMSQGKVTTTYVASGRIAQHVVPTRAFENQVFVAYVNRCGHEAGLNYCGLSYIVSPDGKDLVRAGTSDCLLPKSTLPILGHRGKKTPIYVKEQKAHC